MADGEEKMAKITQSLDDHWAVLQHSVRESRYGGAITEITLVRLEDYKIAHTYIDPDNKNSKYWQDVLANEAQERGQILKGLKFKTKGGIPMAHSKHPLEPLINADSCPDVYTRDKQTILDAIWEDIREQAEPVDTDSKELWG